jgi:hypothetical protein
VTGFLLRSQAVQGWKNMGANAYAKGSAERLPLLRFERLAPSVMIGLFAGVIYQLDLHEAPQALHFGVDAGGKKSLRYDAAGPFHKLGEPMPADPANQVPLFFRDAGRRVLDVAKLSADLNGKLHSGAADPLPSSDFALQMIEGVGMVSFTFERK